MICKTDHPKKIGYYKVLKPLCKTPDEVMWIYLCHFDVTTYYPYRFVAGLDPDKRRVSNIYLNKEYYINDIFLQAYNLLKEEGLLEEYATY